MSSPDILVERNVMVTMRDGVRLATDIYRPAGEGQWPVLVTRIPYNKDMPFGEDPDRRIFMDLNLDSMRVIRSGYVIVVQDTRGRFASEGKFTPFLHEQSDGVDIIEWAARQPWSTGKVGMYGVSYQGITQWHAAAGNPAALAAIAPAQSFAHWHPYQGGALCLSVVAGWTATEALTGELQRQAGTGSITTEQIEQARAFDDNLPSLFERLPLVNMPFFRDHASYYFDWLAHPDDDAYWQRYAAEGSYQAIEVPALILAGWYDYFLAKDLQNYKAMRECSGSDIARTNTRLIIGPWSHGNFWAFFPGREYLQSANQDTIDLTGIQLRWFDLWLKAEASTSPQEKPVRIFVLGTNTWRDEDDWPLPDTRYSPYYLQGSKVNQSETDATLSAELPGDSKPDVYTYDPKDPVPSMDPTTFAGIFGQFSNQAVLEARPDVLCYTTPPLDSAVEVTGPVQLVLYASSSALDTDFTAKLVDVHPDGWVEFLTAGILRARYRDSLSHPVLMEPGKIYELHLDLGAIANVFLPGHRIRLEVSSSNFPRFDRNSNTGGTIATESATDFITATNSIYHSSLYPSHLILPIIERD